VILVFDIGRERNELAVLADAGELQHVPAAHFEAAPAADALALVDGLDELRRPARPSGILTVATAMRFR